MFQLYIVIHAGAFKIYFAAVVMVLGGVSLLTNQKLYRFLVKPLFEFVVFPQFRSRLSACRALRRHMERQINIYSNIYTYLQIFRPRYKSFIPIFKSFVPSFKSFIPRYK